MDQYQKSIGRIFIGERREDSWGEMDRKAKLSNNVKGCEVKLYKVWHPRKEGLCQAIAEDNEMQDLSLTRESHGSNNP